MTCDPVKLTAELIRCASVTPKDDGAIGVVKMALEEAGFACTEIERGGVKNLFARWGEKGSNRTFGFNGHIDVVPIGNEADWTYGPFSAEIAEGKMWGRGAVDMKSGVAAFVAAAVDIVTNAPPSGSIVITVTGDEEGPATDGTTAILDWMAENSENISACLVGEPTCPNEMGEMMKIGRRGSMTAYFVAHGVQGHSAYPHRAKNPVTAIAQLGAQLTENPMDTGTDHFEPSTLALTTIDVGNAANNVIPASATMTVNIRFNDAHTSTSVEDWLRTKAKEVEHRLDLKIDVDIKVSGESFVTPPGELSDLVSRSVENVTGRKPELSTTGGTSDARFIKNICPVVEFGLVGKTMHQVDENVDVDQIGQLAEIYKKILTDYFAS